MTLQLVYSEGAEAEGVLPLLPQLRAESAATLTPTEIIGLYLTAEGDLTPGTPFAVEASPPGEDPTSARAQARAAKLASLVSSAWAETTRRAYGYHVKAWMAWCEEEGVPPLPLTPRLVADHLTDYGLKDVSEDEDGDGFTARVSSATVSHRLAALNRLAMFVGESPPGHAPEIEAVLKGFRTRYGVAPTRQKMALDYQGLQRCLVVCAGGNYALLRDWTALLVRVRTGAGSGQLARLRWEDVETHNDGVRLRLERSHRYRGDSVADVPRHEDARLCLLENLERLRRLSSGEGPLFTGALMRDGIRLPLTRQGLHLILGKASGDWEGMPGFSDARLRRLLPQSKLEESVAGVRDAAVLQVGFWAALRRSNIVMLNWEDIVDYGTDGIALRIRRSKTDQMGEGATLWLPDGRQGAASDPAGDLRRWKKVLEKALGRAVQGREPVFVPLRKGSTPATNTRGLVRMEGETVNEVVQRLVLAAGLCEDKPGELNPYGAHSLRAGFVTEALRDGKVDIPAVLRVTLHKNTEMVLRYDREVNEGRHGAARALLDRFQEADQANRDSRP